MQPQAQAQAAPSGPGPSSASQYGSRGAPSRSYSQSSQVQASSSSSRPPHQQHRPSNSNAQQYFDRASRDRPIQDVLPHNDYETSHVASANRDRLQANRTASRDRDHRERERADRPPQLPTRSKSSAQAPHPDHTSRQHRRPTSRSATQYNPPPANNPHRRSHSASRQQNPPDMPSRNGADAAPADGHSGGQKQSRSRSIIPTPSGKWILGKTIGAGSMGKVKLARKEETGEQVLLRPPLHSLGANTDEIGCVQNHSPWLDRRQSPEPRRQGASRPFERGPHLARSRHRHPPQSSPHLWSA